MGTWKGKLTLNFDGISAKDWDELQERLEEMFDHEHLEYDDMDVEYVMSDREWALYQDGLI